MKHNYKKVENRKEKGPSISLRIYCFLFNKKIIKLIDFEEEAYYTYLLENCTRCGGLHCYVYWSTKTKDITLNLDGTIANVSYITSWEPYKK
jgi:hypothetical protein